MKIKTRLFSVLLSVLLVLSLSGELSIAYAATVTGSNNEDVELVA